MAIVLCVSVDCVALWNEMQENMHSLVLEEERFFFGKSLIKWIQSIPVKSMRVTNAQWKRVFFVKFADYFSNNGKNRKLFVDFFQ